MIDYKDYFSDSFDKNQHIIGLLNMGFRADEISKVLNVSDDEVVKAINDFADKQMSKIKFNGLMERLGYDYEREETETLFG